MNLFILINSRIRKLKFLFLTKKEYRKELDAESKSRFKQLCE